MEEEVFLNITTPGAKEHEERLKASGFIEKKYTRATKLEIEGAIKRYLLKQLIPARGVTTPAQINALAPELNAEVQKLYIIAPSGERFLKIKMFVPSPKLIKEREAAMMAEEVEAEEAFAPANYGEMSEVAEKANTIARAAIANVSKLRPNSTANNINSAISKASTAKTRVTKMLPKVAASPLAGRVQAAINALTMAEARAQAVRSEYSREANELAKIMERTNFGTHLQYVPKNGRLIPVKKPEYTEYSPELSNYLAGRISNIGLGGKRHHKKTHKRHTKHRHTKRKTHRGTRRR